MNTQQPVKQTYTTEESKIMRAAKRLPAPVPGVEIKIPLRLVPTYLKLHGITPKGYRNSVLLVKRELNGAGLEESK